MANPEERLRTSERKARVRTMLRVAVAAAKRGVSRLRRWREGNGWLVAGVVAMFTFCRMASFAGWDNAYYFGQLTSILQDRDLLLHDDLLDYPNSTFDRLYSATNILETGAVHNAFSIGPAVLHSAYLWPVLGSRSTPWGGARRVLAVGALFMTALTALATHAAARACGFSAAAASLGTAAAMVGGPLAVYGTRVYVNSHLTSALAAAALVLACIRWRRYGGWDSALVAGLASGVLVLQRWQDATLAAGALLVGACGLREGRSWRSRIGELLCAGATLAATGAIQLLVWRAYYGAWWLVPQGADFMRWTEPRVWSFLLSGYHGLVPWMPVFALGLVGVLLMARDESGLARQLGITLFVCSVASIYVCSVALDWWAGASFGPRRLTALTPVAALGLAAVFEKLRRGARVVLAGMTVLWTSFTASAWLSGWDDLAVVLFGRASAANPGGMAPYQGVTWLRWGPLYFLKPGFSFSDAPTALDRMTGLVAVVGIVGAAAVLRACLRGSSRLRGAAIGCCLAWVMVWVVGLASVKSNTPHDAAWRGIVRGATEVPEGLPEGMREAATVVIATRHAARGDLVRFADLMDVADRSGAIRISREGLVSVAEGRLPPPMAP
jgi:hypothetical protein